MEDLSFPNRFEICADSIENLEHEIERTEYTIRNTLQEMDLYLQDKGGKEFAQRMNEYCYETHKICDYMHEFATKLLCMSRVYTDASPLPIFDFIVNFDVGTWWRQAYPIIEQIATVTGAITDTAAITTAPLIFIKWMRSKLQEKKNKDEYAWVKLILSKEEWTILALSEITNLPEDVVKKILKGFGFKWNPQKMLYVSTENTQKLRDIDIHETNH